MKTYVQRIILLVWSTFWFTQMGNAQTIIFEDDFETGSLGDAWTARPNLSGMNGFVEVVNTGAVSGEYCVRMGRYSDGGYTTNALDLNINLTGHNEVLLDFWIRDFQDETHIQDGLYFSDDGGTSFTKVMDFKPSAWYDHRYGKFPPLDVDYLASINGLKLTDQFIIRFQQHDNSDLISGFQQGEADGMFLDNVRVYEPKITYASVPFSDGFEAARLNNNWAWSNADSTIFPLSSTVSTMGSIDVILGIGIDNSYAVRMGSRCDRNSFATNALDLFVNLSDLVVSNLSFYIRDIEDESHTQDGIYLSVDGGKTFEKIYEFEFQNQPNHLFVEYNLDLTELATQAGLTLSDSTIIRFQQHDNSDFISGFQQGEKDGIYLDNISITGIPTGVNGLEEISLTVYPNPIQSDLLSIDLSSQTSPTFQYSIIDMHGRTL